jgi:hypothetical protein
MPLAVLLSASAAKGEVKFEETEFAGWATGVFDFADRTVSGATQPTGGNPGAHYLVRHTHEHFAFFANTASSVSFSPRRFDPAELVLASGPRFSVDLRFEVDHDGPQTFSPSLYWAPALWQGETVYRFLGTESYVFAQGRFVHVEVDLRPEQWLIGQRPPLDLSAGAPPVRLGLVLQSDVVVAAGEQGEVRIGVDNLRIETIGEDDLPEVTLVALPSPAGDHVVFAPPQCFDGTGDGVSFDVHADVSRYWDGIVDLRAPNLTASPAEFEPRFSFGTGTRPLEARQTLLCQSDAPTLIEMLPPMGDLRALLGTPSTARVEPCLVRVGGGYLPCNGLQEVCFAEAVFYLSCVIGPNRVSCLLPDDGRAVDRELRANIGGAFGAADNAIEILRRVRDEKLSATPAGRYYRDLYDAFSPELRDLVIGDLRLVRDIFAAAPAWLEALGALVDGAGDEAIVTPAMTADMLAIFDRIEAKASPALRELFQRERARLRLGDFAGRSIDDAFALIEDRGVPPACATSDTALCVQGGRFRVEVTWTDFKGRSGPGRVVALSSDSGYFWFFNRENVELAVKVLDGRAVNGQFWVFYGALSNVEYTVLVTDTATGAVRAYRNPSGVFASVGDTSAFAPDGAAREVEDLLEEAGDVGLLTRLTEAASETLRSGWRRLRDALPGFAAGSVNTVAGSAELASTSGPRAGQCLPSLNALCLAGNRFRVEVEWRNFGGRTGVGTSRPLTADTGAFWFFNAENTELIVKVLDGRTVNGHFWVFYGALSNVEYTLRVTDAVTGAVRTYRNPAGTFASRGDVEAF